MRENRDSLIILAMADRDVSQEALKQVEHITESDRDNGEDLLESEDLKRQLREARKRVGLSEPDRQESVE